MTSSVNPAEQWIIWKWNKVSKNVRQMFLSYNSSIYLQMKIVISGHRALWYQIQNVKSSIFPLLFLVFAFIAEPLNTSLGENLSWHTLAHSVEPLGTSTALSHVSVENQNEEFLKKVTLLILFILRFSSGSRISNCWFF